MEFLCDRRKIRLTIPDDSLVYTSRFPVPTGSASELVTQAMRQPIESAPLSEAVKSRRDGNIVIVVSDITRPIPYATFLPNILDELESTGVPRREIVILIATGMHRPSSAAERIEMFGSDITSRYKIVDHRSDCDENLVTLDGKSWSGNTVRLNSLFMNAGFRIITGLVEPHFMAGFSGGRKSVCPGLSSLETLQQFHGYEYLNNPLVRNGNLNGNPLHEEALSVGKLAGVDFSINVVLNRSRRIVSVFAGQLDTAHRKACEFVGSYACPPVEQQVDIALTSSGGYPLDATFYQCVKGMVGVLPAVKPGGAIISFGGCSEGVGSSGYAELMQNYTDRWEDFLADISKGGSFLKDQWEFQMQTWVLRCVGQRNLHFVSGGLSAKQLSTLCVNPHHTTEPELSAKVQEVLDALLKTSESKTLAVFPEGPYCAPIGGSFESCENLPGV